MIMIHCLSHKSKRGKSRFRSFESQIEVLFFREDAKEQQVVAAKGETSMVSHKRKRLRRPDTNVLSVKFNELLQPGSLR